MRRRHSPTRWTSLVAVTLVTTGRFLSADDAAPSSDGYKTVSVNAGGKTVPIRVREQKDPLAHATFTDELDHQEAFSAVNPMANKSFSLSSESAQGSSEYKDNTHNTFSTKPYNLDSNSQTGPDLGNKQTFPTNNAFARNATGFEKNYATTTADAGQNHGSPFDSKAATEQNKTVALGDHTTDTYDTSFATKKFTGDEADAVHRSLTQMKNGQMLVTDLPDRPLTIDEVRELLNHGFKPNTDQKPPSPEDQSKPMNDPDYKPEPLRDMPSPQPASAGEDDKDDAVPPPGTIAQPPPENSQSLPQR